jgi:hypothetical protein
MTSYEPARLAARKKTSTDERMLRLRRRIASEREVTRATVLVILPKVVKAARIVSRLRGVPRLAGRYAPLLLPLAGLVFKKSPVLRTVTRMWGLARLLKSVARSVALVRRRQVVQVVTATE